MAIRPAVSIQQVRGGGRVIRRPEHKWYVRHRPWQIQPICLAPVLPGETLRNAVFQSRIVTDPVSNPLIGWWAEQYWFYVKHRDLEIRDELTALMLNPDQTLSGGSLQSGDSEQLYTFDGGVRWAQLCLDRCVMEYFVDEGDAAVIVDGLPLAMAHPPKASWLDSVINDADYTSVDQEIPVQSGAPDHVLASDVEYYMRQWNFEKTHNLTTMTYEDWLRTYGVRVPEQIYRPELIRYERSWTYPTNTVDPSDGAPSSAASWSLAYRADKDRLFLEPGFIFGVSVVRPKVYLSAQHGSAAGIMSNAVSWLPATLADDPHHSLLKVDSGDGPLPGNTDDYWIDVRDLLLYGDQFINLALTTEGVSLIGLPTASLEKKFAAIADLRSLFVDQPGEPDGSEKQFVRQDGVASFMIAGRQIDHT